jgi:RNA polymerase sigma factor (TIGR02999 family)
MSHITYILNAIERGDRQAIDELFSAVYQELRQLAAQKLSREKPGQTLQATALVHEAYIRLVGEENQNWTSRSHFFAAAAEAMRRILIENARRKHRLKHGAGLQKVELNNADMSISEPPEDLIALDDALAKLATEEPVVAELVKLRYFAGLTLEQASEILGISRRTADRYWAYARAWLYKEVTKANKPASS